MESWKRYGGKSKERRVRVKANKREKGIREGRRGTGEGDAWERNREEENEGDRE